MPGTSPYRNAPLALVVVEIRHTQAEPLGRAELAALAEQLKPDTPLKKTEDVNETVLNVNEAGPSFSPTRVRTLNRFFSRDRTTAITFASDQLVVETTDYPGWTRFKEQVIRAFRCRQDVAPILGIERVGLRYIDEIRVPRSEDDVKWTEWVAPTLVGPDLSAISSKLQLRQQQSVLQFTTAEPDETFTLRYGALDRPPVVGSSAHLVRPEMPGPGPFFLFDTDVAWELPAGAPILEPTEDSLDQLVTRLHTPVREVFEASITDRLRNEVLNAE